MTKDFYGDTLFKFLSQVKEHQNCPNFEDEVVRLVRDFVACLNDPNLFLKKKLTK